MRRTFLLRYLALATFAALTGALAAETPPGGPLWEYKAVAFDRVDVGDATKLLNDLSAAGWDYVGPLTNGLVAFRRPLVTTADSAAKKEIDRLQGTWQTLSTELDGQQHVDGKKEKITFSGAKWIARLDGEVTQEGMLKIVDVGARFVQADFVVTEGYKQGDTWTSIYQTDGDKMRWCGCYVSENKVRPRTLTTREGDGYFVRTMKREK